jgi:hypothetical protein
MRYDDEMARKSADKQVLEQLEAALAAVVRTVDSEATPTVIRRIRKGLAGHVVATEAARAATDPVLMPRASFDPSDPKVVGRMVALALLAQMRVPLGSIESTYGSGVYAIYYCGDHPLYAAISGTETPIYVGKADPASGDASTAREQGSRLTGRLLEHAGTRRRLRDMRPIILPNSFRRSSWRTSLAVALYARPTPNSWPKST